MLQETCLEIHELEAHWAADREARTARRRKIQQIDELLEELEKLNLADEVSVPVELIGRVHEVVISERHTLCTRPVVEVVIAEWMDALYDVQDGLMFASDDEDDDRPH